MKTVRMPLNAGVLPALALLVLAIAGWWIAQDWGRSSGMFPRRFGQVFIALAALEVAVQLWRSFVAKQVSQIEVSELIKQIWGLAWLGLLLAMIFLLGFMITVPLFTFLFLRLHGKLSWLISVGIAIGAVLFVELIFRRLLDYTLYPGLLG